MASRTLHSRSRAWSGSPPPTQKPKTIKLRGFGGRVSDDDDDDDDSQGYASHGRWGLRGKAIGDAFSPFQYGIQIEDPVTGDEVWYDLENWDGDDAEDARDEITDDIGDPGWKVIGATDNFLAPGAEVHNDNFESLFNQYRIYQQYGKDGFEFAECFGLDTSGAWDFDEIQSEWDDYYFCDAYDVDNKIEEEADEDGNIPESVRPFIDYGAMAENAFSSGRLKRCGDTVFIAKSSPGPII